MLDNNLGIIQNLNFLHLCVRRQFLSLDSDHHCDSLNDMEVLVKMTYPDVLYAGGAYGSAAAGDSYGWYPVCL